MKKQLLLLSFMFTMTTSQMQSNDTFFDELSFFDASNEKSQWEFMELSFITKPAEAKKFVWSHLSAIVPVSLAMFSAYQYANLPTDNAAQSKDVLKSIREPQFMYPALGMSATTILVCQYLNCYLSAQAHRNAVIEFFANWEDNQFYTPVEFLDAFEEIAEIIEFEGIDAVNSDKIVNTIQGQVMRHFESRYKSVLEAKGINALSDTKTYTEIVKNIFDGAKNLEGKGK